MEERITQSLPALTIIEYDINFTLYKRGVYGSDRWNIDSTNHQNNRLILMLIMADDDGYPKSTTVAIP